MAQVPKPLEDLVRIIARSFYSDIHVVVIDFLVREKYVRQDVLSKRLHLPVKELRTLLLKLQEQKILKSEVRLQKKTQKNTEYQRAMKATFWYIDFYNLVDNITYRVDNMRHLVQEKVAQGQLYQTFRCPRCKEVYSSLDSSRLFVPSEGVMRCDNIILRNTVCGGIVEEVELEGQAASLKELQSRMENELRPILERVAEAESLQVPAHPLEGMDSEQLGMIVTEGQEESIQWEENKESAPRKEEKESLEPYLEQQVKVELVPSGETDGGRVDNVSKLDYTPSWFAEREDNRNVEKELIVELEESLLEAQQKESSVSFQKNEDKISYSLAYYQSLMGQDEQVSNISEIAQEDDILFEDVVGEDSFWQVAQESNISSFIVKQNGETFVKVQGEMMKLEYITEEHCNRMTTDEYLAYYEAVMQLNREEQTLTVHEK
eukprot:jgi/Galph1/1878/GphlegSOOS_G574.1